MCVCMPRLVWLFATTWTVVARQAPLSMGFSRQKYWSGLPFPTPGYLPDPGTEPVSLTSPASAGGFFTSAPPRKPPLPHPPKKPSPFSWKIIQFSYVMVFSYRSLPSINFFRIFLMWKFLHLPTLGWWSFFFFFPKLCHHFGWFNPSEGWPMNHPRFKIPWTLLFQNSHPPLHLSWNLSLPFSVPEHKERNTVWKIMNRIERCCKFIFSKHK